MREREKRLRYAKAQEERERHEREVEEEEKKDDANSLHEEGHVSKRHMTWWQNASWIRVNDGPHMRQKEAPSLASSQKSGRTGLRR